MRSPPLLYRQDKHPGVTVASFDTTGSEELEGLTAELGVKGLPQFRFYQVRLPRLVALQPDLHVARCSAVLGARCRHASAPACPQRAFSVPPLLQGGKEAMGKIMGYKLSPLADAFKQLDGM